MGDVVAVVFGLLIVGGVVTLAIAAATGGARRFRLRKLPTPMLGTNDHRLALTRATTYYRMSQRAVRVMEHMTSDPTVYLEDRDRKAMQDIIDDFYEREGQ